MWSLEEKCGPTCRSANNNTSKVIVNDIQEKHFTRKFKLTSSLYFFNPNLWQKKRTDGCKLQHNQQNEPLTSVVSFRETSFHFSQKSTKVNYKAGLKLGIYAQRWLSTDYKLTNDLKKFTGAVLIREVGQGLELHILQWNWSSQSFKEQFAIVVSTSYTTI
jgi:hypothetical protein